MRIGKPGPGAVTVTERATVGVALVSETATGLSEPAESTPTVLGPAGPWGPIARLGCSTDPPGPLPTLNR